MDDTPEDRERRRGYALFLCLFCCGLLLVAAIAAGMVCLLGGCNGGDDDDSGNCCVDDPFAYEGSPFGSSAPTICGNNDYNCDGIEDQYACGVDAPTVDNQVDERIIYNITAACNASGMALTNDSESLCGACTGTEVLFGWECSEPELRRKRFVPPCPDACNDSLVEVTAFTPPETGQCALYIDHCVPPNGGDGEVCAIVVGT